MPADCHQLLRVAGAELGLELDKAKVEQLLTYAYELEKWNKTYNLSAVRDATDIVKRHVIDALSVLPAIASLLAQRPVTQQSAAIADIGSGGGVPGVVLAIAMPNTDVYLLESVGKKCRFLRHIVHKLGLSPRVAVIQQRVENWQPETPPTIIICRAFTSLANFTTITRHLAMAETTWLAMKSANTATEEAELSPDFTITDNQLLNVPYETAARHLLSIKQTATQHE